MTVFYTQGTNRIQGDANKAAFTPGLSGSLYGSQIRERMKASWMSLERKLLSRIMYIYN